MGVVTGLDSNFCCIKIQTAGDQIFGTLNPATELTDHGFMAALMSPQNTSGFNVIQTTSESGKARPTETSNRQVGVEYFSKGCSTTGYDEPKGLCPTSTNEIPAQKYANYTIDEFHGWDLILKPEEYRDLCENPLEAFNRYIASQYDAELSALNQKLLAKAAGLMGTYPVSPYDNSVSDPLTINILTAAGMANPTGYALIKQLYRKMNKMGNPILVGDGKLGLYMDAVGYSAFNNGGLNGAASQRMEYYRDQDLAMVNPFDDGNDWLLSWLPGTLVMGEWYNNVGVYDSMTAEGRQFVEGTEETTRITLRGVTWDFYRTVDKCTKNVVFRFEKWFDLLPRVVSDAFADCQKYNYALAFNLGCGDTSCTSIDEVMVGTPIVT